MSAIAEVGSPARPELIAAPVIAVQELVHRYESRTALDGVSFEVQPAELFGLLGPNGSGKTTLFRILSTLMLPVAGRAVILGHDSAKEPTQLRREIGVVFQAQSIDLKLTATENLRHQGHLYGLRGEVLRKRVKAILERVGLSDRARDQAETFSGGMQRRLELAKGLLHGPRVLLLDEPTVYLDMKHQIQFYEILERLNAERGMTVVSVTHDLNLAARYAGRIMALRDGRFVADGVPDEVLTPQHVYEIFEIHAAVFRRPDGRGSYIIPTA